MVAQGNDRSGSAALIGISMETQGTDTMTLVKRTLEYPQFGAVEGRLVVYFHGTPGAPEECAMFDQYRKENNLTFVRYDRFSVDSALEGAAYYQRLTDEIVNKAAGKAVDFVGFSIGGFIALQVCRLMGSRVRNLHLVSSAAPLEAGDFIDMAAGKSVFRLAQTYPSVFQLLVRLQGLIATAFPGLVLRMMFTGVACPFFARPLADSLAVNLT
jgi:pimeloyl-ACP methyl ester carboxylesterase